MSTVRHWLWLSTRGKNPERYAARILSQISMFIFKYNCSKISFKYYSFVNPQILRYLKKTLLPPY